MAKSAILLCKSGLASECVNLSRILDFFGVPWKAIKAANLRDAEGVVQDHIVFGSAPIVSDVLQQRENQNHPLLRPEAFYVYADGDRDASERGLRFLCGTPDVSLGEAPAGNIAIKVSRSLADLAGTMAGLELSIRPNKEDSFVTGALPEGGGIANIISASNAAAFVRFQRLGIPTFFCASSRMIDIEEPVGRRFYDVKEYFCSVVPLVMFIRTMFREVAWHPQELGACLIIDDPLLRLRYGSCDFRKLRDLMRRYDFTTNIAFIPWNWRRTSSAAAAFFKEQKSRFSVSIHGCDHTAAEFGATSKVALNNKASLAQSRMRKHESRTGIHHERIMVFPQGVFSSGCPEILKCNGYLAAANTEVVPSDFPSIATRIRDVWDVAIMRYGNFPIFTRRYAHHGLENLAFDLLLGKPCLIVSHHDFFKDNCIELTELIEKLQSLNCRLQWRPLGDVIRRACRRRTNGSGIEEIEMYGTELLIQNDSDRGVRVQVHKREDQVEKVADAYADHRKINWARKGGGILFQEEIAPLKESLFQVKYQEPETAADARRSVRFEVSVTFRRILSEVRDEYVSKRHFFSSRAAVLKAGSTKRG